ncbi:MAG: prepilin-type N-terminal cleavage/methylation domain-containing protein [Acidobacteria bacterium]|nr:prepilin-type N-terminal cleavage/methylation domain-containing protein [Acidobacteriota bacterium]
MRRNHTSLTQPNRKISPHLKSHAAQGFSLLEVLVSVMIITVLMAAVFQFLRFNQQRYRGDQLLAERNQGARSALELMTMELQQAGHNPNLTSHKTLAADVTPTGTLVNIDVGDTTGIFYGNLVEIGASATDPNWETVTVGKDSTHAITSSTFPAIITLPHTSGQPVFTRSLPFPNGILYTASAVGSGQSVAVNTIQYFGDIHGRGTLAYGEYKLVDTGATTTLKCTGASGEESCHLLTLNRFVTSILTPEIPADKTASGDSFSPLADNILGLPDAGGVFRNPDQRPIFQLNYDTFGNVTYGFTTYVRSVDVDITMQTTDKDPEVADYRTIRMRSHIVPTNINYAWGITLLGGSPELPFRPTDQAGHTLPIPD